MIGHTSKVFESMNRDIDLLWMLVTDHFLEWKTDTNYGTAL